MPTSAPPMWFRLPPGYYSLDDVDALEETASAFLERILDSKTGLDDALRNVHSLASLLTATRDGDSVHASVGIHPDGESGACLSFFMVSMTAVTPRPSALAVAQCALAMAQSPLWNSNTGRLLELPSGMPAALVAGRLAPPPPSLLENAGVTAASSEVFQARLTVACPTGEHIAVADLSSAATRHAEAYTSILEGIAQTVSFIEPVPQTGSPQRASRILELS